MCQEQAIPYSTDIYKHYFIEKFYPRNKPNITFKAYISGEDIGESSFECAYTFRNLFNNTITIHSPYLYKEDHKK